MSARTWYTDTNTAGLRKVDLAVLNRAMRHWIGDGVPTQLQLMTMRMMYEPGMGLSAADLVERMNNEWKDPNQ